MHRFQGVANVTLASEQGRRSAQEDRCLVVRLRRKGDVREGRVLAVMDGHGGPWVSEYCFNNLERVLFGAAAQTDDVESMLKLTINSLHVETMSYPAGSTISLCFVPKDGKVATVATLGDSPVITLNHAGEARKATAHSAETNLADREAALRKGAFYGNGYIFAKIGNGLQLTRSLGDGDRDSILSREPEVYSVEEPQLIVVCSDGVVAPQDVPGTEKFEEFVSLVKSKRTAQHILGVWMKNHPLHDNATIVLWKRN